MNTIFKTTKRVTFREADPAQIMFFGNIYGFAHDAFEEFIVHAGFTWEEWFRTRDFMVPIRHSEAEYLSPFFPGKSYDIHVTVEKLGTTSFSMNYLFTHGAKTHAIVRMTHVVLDQKTKEKMPIPELFLNRLKPFLAPAKESSHV